jgi:hypothetical protein
MAFAYTVDGGSVAGDFRVKWGSYTNGGGDTGGAIVTGLATAPIHGVTNSTDENAIEIVEASGTLTIDCTDGDDGKWFAFGFGGG